MPSFIFILLLLLLLLFVVNFVLHWNETAVGLHVFPIPIPLPPLSPPAPPRFSQCKNLIDKQIDNYPEAGVKDEDSLARCTENLRR